MIPKIYECLGKDPHRPIFDYALITKEHTVATDAHIMVVHKTSELFEKDFVAHIPEEGMLLGGDALRDMAKKDVEQIILNKQSDKSLPKNNITVLHRKGGKAIFEVREHGGLDNFPNWSGVMPKIEDNTTVMAIGIDARKLLRLQNALATETAGLKCYFTGESGAILCYPTNVDTQYPSAVGIIMPMKINY